VTLLCEPYRKESLVFTERKAKCCLQYVTKSAIANTDVGRQRSPGLQFLGLTLLGTDSIDNFL
jgi:hypothetical protein